MARPRKKTKKSTAKAKKVREPGIRDIPWEGFWPSREAAIRAHARIAFDAAMDADSPYPPVRDNP